MVKEPVLRPMAKRFEIPVSWIAKPFRNAWVQFISLTLGTFGGLYFYYVNTLLPDATYSGMIFPDSIVRTTNQGFGLGLAVVCFIVILRMIGKRVGLR